MNNEIRRALTGMNMGRALPPTKFFEPTTLFLSWMKKTYPVHVVYDVGAGLGHVAKALAQKKLLKVIALDINYREDPETFPVEIADGECYPYEFGSIVMICRPCHGLFTEEVVSQAIECNAARILYVGLDRNVHMDLGSFYDRFSPAFSKAGKDGETVWVMKP